MPGDKKRSTLTSQSREIVANVASYLKSNAESVANASSGPVSLIARTSIATGVSEAIVSRILRVKTSTEKSSSPESRRKGKRTPYKKMDGFDKIAIRNKIIEFYTVRRQLPTLQSLWDALKEDIKFPGSKSLLRKIVRQLGFRWKKTKSNRSVLVEKESVTSLRLRYYDRKRQLEEQGFDFVYIDETWIDSGYISPYCWQGPVVEGVKMPVSKGQRLVMVHAGTSRGFIPGALLVYKASATTGDYHQEFNGDQFLKWIQEMVLPNLTRRSAIVMDNASYHSVQTDKRPTTNIRKYDMQVWLREHGVEFAEKLTRPQLLELAKLNKTEPTYMIDEVLRANGHEVLRLPPYHPDIHPIELILSQVKQKVASRNTTHRLEDILKLTYSAFEEIGPDQWEGACRHAKKCEEKYMARDHVVDGVFDRFVIDLRADSDDSTDTASEADD